MREIDRAVFFWIHEWPLFLEPYMWFFSEGIKTAALRIILAGVVIGMIVRGPSPRRTIVQALGAVVLATVVTEAIKNSFPTQRPAIELVDSLQRSVGLAGSGTASSHAASMAAVAVVFALHLGKWGWLWAFVALMTGLSRIYDASHFPYQVLIGWVCGAFCGMLVVRTWQEFVDLRNRRTPKIENAEPDPAQ